MSITSNGICDEPESHYACGEGASSASHAGTGICHSPRNSKFLTISGSLRACVFTLVFSAVGVGILSLPWAFAMLGRNH